MENKNSKIKSYDIKRMDKLHLINTDNEYKEGYSQSTRKKIRKIIGIRGEKTLIQLARDSGVELGKRPETQEKRAYDYFANIVNERIIEAREEIKEPDVEPEKIVIIKKKKKTKKPVVDNEIDMGYSFKNNWEKYYKKVKTSAFVQLYSDGKLYRDTFLEKKNKQSVAVQFYNFIMKDSSVNHFDDLLDNDLNPKLTIIYSEEPKPKKINQKFKEGSFNCVLKPIKDFIEEKIESSQTKKTKDNYKSILNKIIELNSIYYDKGVDKDNLAEISKILNIDINISLPFQDDYISVKSNKHPLRKFCYINNKLNHVEYDKIYYDNNIIELTEEEIEKKYNELCEKKIMFPYKKSSSHKITEIRTSDAVYKIQDSYPKMIMDFEIKTGLDKIKICDIKNDVLSDFVRQSLHFHGHVDFNDYRTDMTDFKYIDMEKAYYNYRKCKYFKKFLGKISDFRKCDKIEKLGIYRINNLNFDNSDLKVWNDKLYVYTNYNVYPSPELEFLKNKGVTFDIIEGCWGEEIDFDLVMLDDDGHNKFFDKDKFGCPNYSKYVGQMTCGSLLNSIYLNHYGDDEYAGVLREECECNSLLTYNDNIIKANYVKQNNYHLSHVASFILSYMRMNVFEQLEQFKPNEIRRIASDGIYFYPKQIQLKNCFRYENDKRPSKNIAGVHYISNHEVSYDPLLEVAPYRKYNKLELHTGQGGGGKTHHNLTDKGLVNVIFFAPTWKLARKKQSEYNIDVNVTAKLLLTDPQIINYYTKYYSVFIIDEVSMMSNEEKKLILKNYPRMKIIFCGDIGFQLPPFNEDGSPVSEFVRSKNMSLIEHNTNYRVSCEKLKKLLTDCRDMMKHNKSIKNYVLDNVKTIKESDMNYNHETDLIICSTNKTKDFYTEKYKNKNKYYITKSDRIYGTGEIYLETPLTSNYELRHAFTIHSIQGETCLGKLFISKTQFRDNRLIYTALSRAKKIEQIYLVDDEKK